MSPNNHKQQHAILILLRLKPVLDGMNRVSDLINTEYLWVFLFVLVPFIVYYFKHLQPQGVLKTQFQPLGVLYRSYRFFRLGRNLTKNVFCYYGDVPK
jgi:hypothetical protein